MLWPYGDRMVGHVVGMVGAWCWHPYVWPGILVFHAVITIPCIRSLDLALALALDLDLDLALELLCDSVLLFLFPGTTTTTDLACAMT